MAIAFVGKCRWDIRQNLEGVMEAIRRAATEREDELSARGRGDSRQLRWRPPLRGDVTPILATLDFPPQGGSELVGSNPAT